MGVNCSATLNPKADWRKYIAEKWSDVYGPNGHHELWAVLDNKGDPVAFGGQAFCEATANNYNEVYADLNYISEKEPVA